MLTSVSARRLSSLHAVAADPQRVLADLRALRELTATAAGAQRLAWTPAWAAAREWLLGRLEPLPVDVEVDEAGNLWATLAGESEERAVLIGSHLDSVPDGGWLDGCLGVIAALEVLRAFATGGRQELGLRLVDWADEEGARFGRSLFGSSAAAGMLAPDEVRGLRDAAGVSLPDALASCGVALDDAPRAAGRLSDVAAYVELHIEQGPVLEDARIPVGVVEGIVGARRAHVRFEGRAAHAGATPMHLRRDPVAAAARLALEVRRGAVRASGVATVGQISARPGIPTAVAEEVTLTVDQRHRDPQALRRMLDDARAAARTIAAEERTPLDWVPVQAVEPVRFDAGLVELGEESVRAVAGECLRLHSGALHDAAMVARAGTPAVMLFVQSIGGISHNRLEDSHAQHIEQGVEAFDLVVSRLAGG
jgi:hydantoinase/carbamoylase family amidase